MSEQLFDEIPSLDLADFNAGSETTKSKFVKDLGNTYQNIGFVAIKNHGLSDELVRQLYETIEEFFKLPESIKTKYEKPELFGQRGYIGKGKEHAKGRTTGDLKEFYHIGQFVEGNDSLANKYPHNIWPEEIKKFEAITRETYQTLEKTGKTMLQAIALYLELPENYFENKVHNGNSILRPIHYFPIDDPDSVPSDAVRAAEHGDINLITLLMGASADGLQVLRRDGKWIPITALPDQIVVNVGDMLARLTNDKLKSTIHRVVNPPKELMSTSRYSIPFFMHPRADMDLTCLKNCINKNYPKLYEDMTAGEFLHQRLAEIGLIK
ncbi:isopenicillin N synthase family dioxygenase [Reichenbachiella versicolor]|uniref:isopenicillin N synthase family dioxygenase n=1 Tax=Reichenbachiella versicolor TaxID=1821036 RepID=UPI000D6E6F46|nr:2-oxoglutarate and iron-dependent oxygenase domain-containing protein [Reichenbachiella versicolor]